MSFLFTADWHLHLWRICSRNGGYDRLADGISVGRQIFQSAQAAQIPLIIGGDLKELRGSWLVPVQNAVLGLFREFPDIRVHIISGQHDGIVDGKSGLDFLRELPNVTVFDEPRIIDGADAECVVGYWPYSRDTSQLPEFLELARSYEARFLFAHAYLQAAQIGPSEIRLKKGHTIDEFGLFGKDRVFQAGFFGDIHKQQKVGNHIWYAGSPYALKSDEREVNKGPLLVQTKNGKITLVDMIPVKAPRFILADWAQSDQLDGLVDYLKQEPDVWAGHFIKLLVSQTADFRILEEIQRTCQARDFQVIPIRKQKVEKRAEIHAGLSRRELLTKYVTARPPVDGISQKSLLAAGLRLLGEDK